MLTLKCPVCGRPLEKTEKTYRCGAGHSYDIAKKGYVNLLPPSAGGKRRGDDKLMVKARTAFLDKGFYDALSNELAECVESWTGEHTELVDAGCGEGKYTFDILQKLTSSGKEVGILGIDISKDALIQAAKRSREFALCAASLANIPLAEESADMIINVFAPFMREEFLRVLKPEGVLVRVVPLEDHLWELKQLIYDRPYKNPPAKMEVPGLRIVEERRVSYKIHLESGEDIMNLFMMTPYYYKTSAGDQRKAETAESLTTSVEFGIYVYKKA